MVSRNGTQQWHQQWHPAMALQQWRPAMAPSNGTEQWHPSNGTQQWHPAMALTMAPSNGTPASKGTLPHGTQKWHPAMAPYHGTAHPAMVPSNGTHHGIQQWHLTMAPSNGITSSLSKWNLTTCHPAMAASNGTQQRHHVQSANVCTHPPLLLEVRTPIAKAIWGKNMFHPFNRNKTSATMDIPNPRLFDKVLTDAEQAFDCTWHQKNQSGEHCFTSFKCKDAGCNKHRPSRKQSFLKPHHHICSRILGARTLYKSLLRSRPRLSLKLGGIWTRRKEICLSSNKKDSQLQWTFQSQSSQNYLPKSYQKAKSLPKLPHKVLAP